MNKDKITNTEKLEVSKNNSGLFHYTNLEALRGILESGTLWATDARYLNDSSEFQLMWDKILPYFNDYYSKAGQKIKEQYGLDQDTFARFIAQDSLNTTRILKSILSEELSVPL